MFALLLCLLIRASCADAEEANPAARIERPTPLRPIAPASTTPESKPEFSSLQIPNLNLKFAVTPSSMYSTTEFRPRGTSLSATGTATHDPSVPMLRDTNIWERLADFKSSRGIRLLTLWESRGSTLSLQAGHGHGGGALLQWTSRSFGRGEGTHSLLDHLFSTSIGNMQPMSRAVKSAAPTRPVHLLERQDESGAQPRD